MCIVIAAVTVAHTYRSSLMVRVVMMLLVDIIFVVVVQFRHKLLRPTHDY